MDITSPRRIIFMLFFLLVVNTTIFGQCSTYIQMVDIGIEGCSLPIIVETQQILTPCSSPAGFWDLEVGEFAYVDYTISGCANICQVGGEVDITCFSRLTDIKIEQVDDQIKLYPTITESIIFIDGIALSRANLYDLQGRLVITKSLLNSGKVDISDLPGGIYYVQVITDIALDCFVLLKI